MARRQGTMEAGDIYAPDESQVDGRGEMMGRLVIDLDNNYFYQRSEGRTAKRLSYDTVMWMVANDLVEFDHDDTRDFLVDYMIRLDTQKKEVREAEMKRLAKERQIKVMDADKKLVRKTKRRAMISRIVWTMGCLVLAFAAYRASIPDPEPPAAAETMEGEGVVYLGDENENTIKNATYLTALGNGTTLFGLVFDNNTQEVGVASSTDSAVKENVMLNAAVSQKYPLHLRPLYYDKTNFYQSMLKINDARQGSSAVFLQNPNGAALGKPQNELVLCGGTGMASIVLQSPEVYHEPTAEEVAAAIQKRQNDLIRDVENGDFSQSNYATNLPDGWIGFDYCDIDNDRVAASYWYTKNSSGKESDLRRKVAVFNIESVYQSASDGVGDIKTMLLNYQDEENNFYAPVISCSPASNGAHHWIGYMKQATDGATGFFIRKYVDVEDIMLEDLTNTFSTLDITGSSDPLTNYTLYNDYLFYEQRGFIWVINLSKLEVTPDPLTHTKQIQRENPIQICRANDIRPSTSRDELQMFGNTATPVSHYQVTTLTTSQGVETGIAFIEADSGDLVFKPIRGTAVAAATVNVGAGANANSVDAVSSGDAVAVKEADDLNEAKNEARENRKNKNNEEPRALTQDPSTENLGEVGNGGDSLDYSDDPYNTSAYANETGGTSTHDEALDRLYGEQQSASGSIATSDYDPTQDPALAQQQGQAVQDPALLAAQQQQQQQQQPVVGQDAASSGVAVQQDAASQIAASNASEAVRTAGTEKIVIRAGASIEKRIVCFAVRGEQFFWIEEDDLSGAGHRSIRVSPVYYKQEKLVKNAEAADVEAENGTDEVSDDSTDDEAAPVVVTTPDNATGGTTTAQQPVLPQNGGQVLDGTQQQQPDVGIPPDQTGAQTGISDSLG